VAQMTRSKNLISQLLASFTLQGIPEANAHYVQQEIHFLFAEGFSGVLRT